MNITHYNPKNEILSLYIDSYYFISKCESHLPFHYMTFPNNLCIVSTIQNSSVKLVDRKVIIAPSTNKSIVTDVVVRYIKPLEVVYQKSVNEITIKFKPLGFNHFVNKPSDYFKDFDEQMDTILNISNKNEQVENLEKYWLSKLKIVELDKIEVIMQYVESALSIAEIARKHNISRQYLNIMFTKNLGKTPLEFRKFFKFKKALKSLNV